jgi:arabinogalactan endo-1,4-beta-galactosidase
MSSRLSFCNGWSISILYTRFWPGEMCPLDETLGSSVFRSSYFGRVISSETSYCWTLFPQATNNNVAKANNTFFMIYKFKSFDF